LFSIPEKKNQEMMMSLSTCHYLFHLKKKCKKPLSSSATKAKQPRMTMSQDPGLLSFALEGKNQEMTTKFSAHCRLLELQKEK